MKFIVSLAVLATFAAVVNGNVIQLCSSSADVNVNDVTITGCNLPGNRACIFKKGTRVQISLPFTPRATYDKTDLTARAVGIVHGVPIPFGLPNTNACVKSGLTCPVVAGTPVTYTTNLPILSIYPTLDVTVELHLRSPRSPKSDVVCLKFPVKIQ